VVALADCASGESSGATGEHQVPAKWTKKNLEWHVWCASLSFTVIRKARNLARYQRRMFRCQRGSANRAKAAAKVAIAHRKVRNGRRDFLHRASIRLVR
jgi:transposase